ncbi:hypothetical protein CEUSTIGMA_g3326.t1 [Chlamydomonas eustigma]|uniref:Protein kinase domain-containing protein n=1 Tax=Chlamydomonas eustigma TaxID=1157962 RepID=A0A250WYG7_9CHLO|nr:hypothetical protein CEUSTIGMA_g3326.t1 [Chlamydomonas eustigma]|eukprot:GAX75883.1 hypothetical protein CEUSTIGMA_g3326.t1 [Chlamydomonas eustigma]
MGSSCTKGSETTVEQPSVPSKASSVPAPIKSKTVEEIVSNGSHVTDTQSYLGSTDDFHVQPAHEDEEYIGSIEPSNEAARLQTLKNLAVLDTEPEKRFDDITKLCTMIFKVPICLVSLVETNRQWFKSKQGLDVTETDRKSSFCAWTLLPHCPTVLVVENALEDTRFCSNPLVVGFPHIRFYAGTPLVGSNGHRYGSLCIIDRKPVKFNAESCTMLSNFGEMVVRQIEKDMALEQQQQKNDVLTQEKSNMLRAISMISEAIMMLDLSQPEWMVLFVNDAMENETGVHKEEDKTVTFWDSFELIGSDEERTRTACHLAIAEQQNFDLTVRSKKQNGTPEHTLLMLQFRSANNSTLDANMPRIAVPSTMGRAAHYEGEPCYYYASVKRTAETPSTIMSSTISGNINDFAVVMAHLDAFSGEWNGTTTAIKILEHEQKEDGGEILEALLSAQISHPNIVKTFKHCTRAVPMAHEALDGKTMMETWMIMEFCNKGTLSDAVDCGWFRRRNSMYELDYGVILKTLRDIAAAMTYLHSLDMLHGDLTGSNIMLSSSDMDQRGFLAKVADFGFTRVVQTRDIKTKTHGAISHTAPELLLEGTLSKAADVYSFGVILWEMYSGKRPYGGMTQGQVIQHISARRGLALNSGCPPPLRKFIHKCTSIKPADRPTFPQILVELEELEEELV